MDTPNSAVTGLRNGALTLVVAVLLFGVGSTAASADPSITPTPQPQGPFAREGGVNAPPPRVNPGDSGPCFSCAPNQIPPQAPAATVTPPELTGSNSGVPATATNLVIWGDHFHPGDAVHIEVRTNDGTRYWSGDTTADAAGNVKVKTSRGTDNTTPVDGYAIAIDNRAGIDVDSNRLPVAVKGAPW